jgi:hypothetical protein
MLELTVLVAFAAVVAALWMIGAREPVYRMRGEGAVWFIAVRGEAALAPGVRVLWSASSDFALIGAEDAYWTRFLVVSGPGASPLAGEAFEDVYVARLRLLTPPRMALGLVRLLVLTGILSRPSTETVATDPGALGFRADAMPSAKAVATLLARPAGYAPAMVNFLAYRDHAPGGETGRAAYRRYGLVAMRTVFRTGGALLFYATVTGIVRAAKAGPTVGAWHDIAAMRYPHPRAILSMEHVPEYRAALKHRDAGLARTVVIASTPD